MLNVMQLIFAFNITLSTLSPKVPEDRIPPLPPFYGHFCVPVSYIHISVISCIHLYTKVTIKRGAKGGIIIFKGVSCPQVCNAINVTCKTCKSNLQLNKRTCRQLHHLHLTLVYPSRSRHEIQCFYAARLKHGHARDAI